MSMTLLGDALKKRMGMDRPLQAQAEAGLLISLAGSILNDFVGPDNSKYIKPLFIKNRTLTITCASSALSQEIHLNQAKIINQINEKFGQNALDRIRYLL
jgi:hypothetical protein